MPERDDGKRGHRMALVILALAAAALWAASRVAWVQVRTVDDLRGTRLSTLNGETWSAELAPLAVAVLAAVAAALALRGLARRAVGVVLVVVGVAAAVPGAQLLFGGASTDRAAGLVTPAALPAHTTVSTSLGGPALALAGAVLTLAAAVLLLRSPRAAAGLSSRYQSPAALKAAATARTEDGVDENVSERLLWDALDAGRDPTADAADGARTPTPANPPGDADHRPDSVGADESGDTEGSASRP